MSSASVPEHAVGDFGIGELALFAGDRLAASRMLLNARAGHEVGGNELGRDHVGAVARRLLRQIASGGAAVFELEYHRRRGHGCGEDGVEGEEGEGEKGGEGLHFVCATKG